VPNGIIAQQGFARVHKLNDSSLAYDQIGKAVAEEVTMNELSTPRGGQYQVKLPDGTRVWLDASTTLRYPSAFNGGRREVELTEGQAYFEVAHKKEPFSVRVHGAVIDGV
jgi:transmembrane sensor